MIYLTQQRLRWVAAVSIKAYLDVGAHCRRKRPVFTCKPLFTAKPSKHCYGCWNQFEQTFELKQSIQKHKGQREENKQKLFIVIILKATFKSTRFFPSGVSNFKNAKKNITHCDKKRSGKTRMHPWWVKCSCFHWAASAAHIATSCYRIHMIVIHRGCCLAIRHLHLPASIGSSIYWVLQPAVPATQMELTQKNPQNSKDIWVFVLVSHVCIGLTKRHMRLPIWCFLFSFHSNVHIVFFNIILGTVHSTHRTGCAYIQFHANCVQRKTARHFEKTRTQTDQTKDRGRKTSNPKGLKKQSEGVWTLQIARDPGKPKRRKSNTIMLTTRGHKST